MHSVAQPKQVGKYEIIETLAWDGSWRIFRAFDPFLRRSITLKTILRDALDAYGSAMVARWRTEAREAARLNHPGIVGVYEYGEDSDLAFIAMEYAEGCFLRPKIRFPSADAVSATVQLLDALQYAHDQGLVHRQIRPASLLLTSKGCLRIADFGVVTLDGGASNYTSPEQLTGLAVDRRSDVFSAGVVFYELLTGVHPFAGSADGLIDRESGDKERPASEVNPNLPRVFDQVCAKSLAKATQDRYPTARTFNEAVRGAFESAYGAPPNRVVSHETVVAMTFGDTRSLNEARSPLPAPRRVSPESLRGESSLSSSTRSRMERVFPAEAKSRPKPEVDPVGRPLPEPMTPGARPEARQEIKADVKPVKSEVKMEVKKHSASSDATHLGSRLEQIPFQQPENLAGYLQDKSPQVEEVLGGLIGAVQALAELQATKTKPEALVPESVCFDRLGKATIRRSQATSTQANIGVVGNPRYAAPEIFSEKASGGDSAPGASHIYALGFMFYEILLGKKLFDKTFLSQRTDLDWLRWHADLEAKAPPLKSLLTDCPAALSDLLESMMEKRTEKRAADLQAILTSLRSIAQRANKTVVLRRLPDKGPPPPAGAKTPAAPQAIPEKKGRGGLVLLLVLLLVLAVVGFLLWQDPDIYRALIAPFDRLYHLIQ